MKGTASRTPAGLRSLVEVVGADRVALGSDFPFDMGVPDPVAPSGGRRRRYRHLRRVAGGDAAALLDRAGIPSR